METRDEPLAASAARRFIFWPTACIASWRAIWIPGPQITADPGNFVEFDYERRVNGVPETRRARGRLFALPGDF